jgi:hypothetical protein
MLPAAVPPRGEGSLLGVSHGVLIRFVLLRFQNIVLVQPHLLLVCSHPAFLMRLMAARSLPKVAMHDLGGRSREQPITKIHPLRWMARSKNMPFRDLERRDGSPFTSLFRTLMDGTCSGK